MKIAPRQITSFLAKPPDQISAILLHGSDSGLRSVRSQQLATLYSDDLDDVFSVTRISGAGLGGEPGKIADAAGKYVWHQIGAGQGKRDRTAGRLQVAFGQAYSLIHGDH